MHLISCRHHTSALQVFSTSSTTGAVQWAGGVGIANETGGPLEIWKRWTPGATGKPLAMVTQFEYREAPLRNPVNDAKLLAAALQREPGMRPAHRSAPRPGSVRTMSFR